jgi:hypothetical protein
MTTEQQRDDMSRRIAAVDSQALAVYTAHVGLAHHRAKAEAAARVELLWQSGQGIIPPADAAASGDKFSGFFRDGGRDTRTLAVIVAGIVAVENAPGFAEAMTLITPMVAERDRLAALAISEERAHRAAHAAALDAERDALARATANMETDPGVIAARAALAKFHPQAETPPVALVRGKIKVPCPAEEMAADMH